jgi:hypothetical protein
MHLFIECVCGDLYTLHTNVARVPNDRPDDKLQRFI